MFVNNSPWIWLIPFSAILIIITSWVMIVRHFQHRIEKILKGLRFALRDFQSRRKLLERQSRNYSVRDPEPFRSLSTRLREAVAIFRHRLDSLERRLVALHERHTILKSNRWRAFFGNPFAWHNLHSKAAQLHTELAAAKLELLKIQELLEELEQVPWQVAGQIRELHRNLTTAAQLLGWQQTRGLQGKTFEAALIQCQEIDSAIQHAPILFLEGEKTSLLKSTEKASTSVVYELVRSNRTVLEQLVQQARCWEKDYLKTADSVFAMRQALDALNQELTQVPPGLIILDEGAESPRLEELAQDLQVTASQLEIESLSFVRQEADRLTASIVEQTRELQQASRDLESLEAILGELTDGFQRLSAQLAETGARQIRPIRWEASLEGLGHLEHQVNASGKSKKGRSFAELSTDLADATRILLKQQELGRRIQEIDLSHCDLATLLESPEFRQMSDWIKSARRLMEEIEAYSPENWPRLDNAAKLPGELDALAEQVDRLVSIEQSVPLPESDLARQLDQTRQLGIDYRQIANRVEDLRHRQDELQELEAKAQDSLSDLQKNLGQIRLIASSNQFLAGIALSEMDLLVRDTQKLSEELDQRRSGSVEKKFRQAAALDERATASATRWMGMLNKENQLLLKELAQAVGELDSIARLEDASVASVHKLLSSETAFAVSKPASQTRLSLQDSILEFKRRSSFWQECKAAQKSLESVRQLIDTHREAVFQHDQARDLAAIGVQRKRSWPPSDTSLESERQDLEILEKEWSALRDRSMKAISFVAQYSSLASRYQHLAERLRQGSSAREKEQRQVEQLEDEIAGMVEPWEQMLIRFSDHPGTCREIRDLLDSLGEGMQEIENDYLRGELDYDGVIQEMKSLQRRVRYYQVALDDEHAIDSAGRVTRRRQTERDSF